MQQTEKIISKNLNKHVYYEKLRVNLRQRVSVNSFQSVLLVYTPESITGCHGVETMKRQTSAACGCLVTGQSM